MPSPPLGIEVPQKRTLVTPELLVPAMASSFGPEFEPIDFAILVGKLYMECGRPGPKQCCWCENIGNVRGRSPKGRYCLLGAAYEFADQSAVSRLEAAGWKVIAPPPGAAVPTGKVCMLPPRKAQEFRAYETLQEACDDYATVLGARFGRVSRALFAKGTTAESVVFAMKADGYFTGDASVYAATVGSVAREVLPLVELLLERDSGPDTFEVLSRLDEYSGAATPIRAGEGEHTVRLDDVKF